MIALHFVDVHVFSHAFVKHCTKRESWCNNKNNLKIVFASICQSKNTEDDGDATEWKGRILCFGAAWSLSMKLPSGTALRAAYV